MRWKPKRNVLMSASCNSRSPGCCKDRRLCCRSRAHRRSSISRRTWLRRNSSSVRTIGRGSKIRRVRVDRNGRQPSRLSILERETSGTLVCRDKRDAHLPSERGSELLRCEILETGCPQAVLSFLDSAAGGQAISNRPPAPQSLLPAGLPLTVALSQIYVISIYHFSNARSRIEESKR